MNEWKQIDRYYYGKLDNVNTDIRAVKTNWIRFVVLFVLGISTCSYSQVLQFNRGFGTPGLDIPSTFSISSYGKISFSGIVQRDTLITGVDSVYLNSPGTSSIILGSIDTANNLEWMNSIGTNYPYSIMPAPVHAIDPLGNLYLVYDFQGTIDADPGVGNITMSAPTGHSAIMISKYNPVGNLIWTYPIFDSAALNYDHFVEIGVDDHGSVILSCVISDEADVDPSTGVSIIDCSAPYVAVTAIIKYDSSGNLIWAHQWSTGGGVNVEDMVFDSDDNIYIVGGGSPTIDYDFGTGIYNDTNAFSGAGVVIAKYDANAQIVWAYCVGGMNNEFANRIQRDSWGNIYVAGIFLGSGGDWAPGPQVVPLVVQSNNYPDIYLLKLDSSGIYMSVKTIGSVDQELIWDMSIGPDNNIYWLIEYWNSSFDFDFTSNVLTAPAYGGGDDLIMVTDTAGRVLNHFLIHTPFSDNRSRSILSTGSSFYILGWHNGIAADYDPGPSYYTPVFQGGGDINIGKYGPNPISTGDPEYSDELTFEAYPNPACDEVIIHIVTSPGDNVVLSVSDVYGSVLFVSQKDGNEDGFMKVNVSLFPPGMYLFEIESEGNRAVRKVIVQ